MNTWHFKTWARLQQKLMTMQLAIVTRFGPCFHAALVIFGREDGNEIEIKKWQWLEKTTDIKCLKQLAKTKMPFSFRVKKLKITMRYRNILPCTLEKCHPHLIMNVMLWYNCLFSLQHFQPSHRHLFSLFQVIPCEREVLRAICQKYPSRRGNLVEFFTQIKLDGMMEMPKSRKPWNKRVWPFERIKCASADSDYAQSG